MVEVKLRWRVKINRKNGKEYMLRYINVTSRSAVFLINYVPYFNIKNNIIEFKPNRRYAKKGLRIRLRWLIKREKKNGKVFTQYYISIPSELAKPVVDLDPYLVPENMQIVFRPKEGDGMGLNNQLFVDDEGETQSQ
ncbi:hypothetical protein AVU39_gp40 [Sulfolobus monocaudavirus SMV2]|uniref:hypothetical protein n=1 Tax=Sulfolobus monocaudavirus SMV2 TaxID=1580591 RepID=UPI0006D31242|nr:hypothetical protein AVU39_gp40 [Sulfolobus monocaudavirus SMV2]AIZ11374.1 hypothetical protein [Sulfolobus monocaudavirus SMV2]